MKPHTDPGVFLAGPVVFLILLGCLAVVVLAAWGLRRQAALVILGERARRRLDRGRALPTLWGLSAAVFVVAAGALLFKTHVLALLGLLLWAAGLALVGAGIAVAAWAVGDDVGRVLDAEEGTLRSLRLGLVTLFLAAWLPGLGVLAALLAAAAGMGAVLEVLLTRDSSPS